MAFTERTLTAVQGKKQFVARDLPDNAEGFPSVLGSASIYSYCTEDAIGTVITADYFGEHVPDGAIVIIAINLPHTDLEVTRPITGHMGVMVGTTLTLFTTV